MTKRYLFFFLSQTSSALIFCTVSHLHVRESRADLPYGTVGARQDLASNTYMTHFEAGIFAAQRKKKKQPKQHEKKKHASSIAPQTLACTPQCVRGSNYQHLASDTMAEGYANAISPDLHAARVNGRTDGRQTETRPPSLAEWKDWRPFCLKLCPSGWKQPRCFAVTTAAVQELGVHAAAVAAAAARCLTLSRPSTCSPFICTNVALSGRHMYAECLFHLGLKCSDLCGISLFRKLNENILINPPPLRH